MQFVKVVCLVLESIYKTMLNNFSYQTCLDFPMLPRHIRHVSILKENLILVSICKTNLNIFLYLKCLYSHRMSRSFGSMQNKPMSSL